MAVAFLAGFDGARLLLSTQLTADLVLEYSGGSKICPLLQIHAISTFYLVETAPNSYQNYPQVVDFGPL